MMHSVSDLPPNMASKIAVSHAGCWDWQGAKNSRGYGCVTNGKGTSMLAHRRAYMELVGEIPEGLQIDHLCMNKACVNPAHLEPVTQLENTRRASALITHCKQGHPFEGDNLRVVTHRAGKPHRVCVTCQRAWSRASSAKRRQAKAAA